jgi:hypothetical protein
MHSRHSATHSVGSGLRSKRVRAKSASSPSSSLWLLIVFIAATSGLGFYGIASGAVNVSWAADKKLTGFTDSSTPHSPTNAISSSLVAPVSSSGAQHSSLRASHEGTDSRVKNPTVAVQKTKDEVTERSVVTTNVGKKPNRKMQVAFAITITRDGKFQDGAAVMAYSIDRAFRNDSMDISMIAFVHPNVTTSRPFLERVGYRY